MLLLAVCLLVGGVSAAPASADTNAFGTTNAAYVNSAAIDTNYGNATDLRMSGTSRYGYIEFVVYGLPSDAVVSSAAIALYSRSVNTSHTLRLHPVSTGWTESTLTWRNRPTFGSAISSVASGPSQTVNVNASNITGNGTYRYALSVSTSGAQNYASDDYTTDVTRRPKLTVNWTRPNSTRPVAFSALMSNPTRALEMRDGGAGLAMVEVCWGSFESGRLNYQQAYIDRMRQEIDTQLNLGRRVTLALGLACGMQSYMSDIGTYIGHDGTNSGIYDLVFNQRVRNEIQRILTKMDEVWGFERLWAIRVTSGGNGEVLYPNGEKLWAYSNGAQNGPDKPPSVHSNPMPGWKPGQTTWNGQPVTATMLREFADWYINGLVNVTLWQKDVLRGLGFAGYVEPVTPGAGVRPNNYDNMTRTDYSLSNFVFRVGAVWETYYSEVFAWASDARVVVYNSSFAEGPQGPGNGDHCYDTDKSLSRTQVEDFSTARFFNWLAMTKTRRYHAENPGYQIPAIPTYGDPGPTGMMAESFRYIRECSSMRAFYWAHEHNLFDGTAPDRTVYFQYIHDYNGPGTYIPPVPYEV